MGKTFYVGVDVSKKTLDVAITESGDHFHSTKKVSNSLKGFREIQAWVQQFVREERVHICLESTGKYGEKLVEYLHQETPYTVSVSNPYKISAYGKSQLLRTKTDKADSKLIASYAARMNPAPTLPEDKLLHTLREKLRYYSALKAEITAEKGKQDHYSDPQIKRLIASNIRRLEIQSERLFSEIERLKDTDLETKTNHDLLVSIPAISTQTALILLTEMIPQKPGHIARKAQTAHAGLAPSIKQSGTSVYSAKLTKLCSTRLKTTLYFPALVAIRHNPVIKAFYLRLLKKGKPKMVAVVASMRKLLLICIGILNNQQPFNPNFIPAFPR